MAASTSAATDQTSSQDNSLDTNLLKEIAKKALVDALNSVRHEQPLKRDRRLIHLPQVNGAKTLVLDSALAGPLGLITEVSLLKVDIQRSPLETQLKDISAATWRGQDVLAGTRAFDLDNFEHYISVSATDQVC